MQRLTHRIFLVLLAGLLIVSCSGPNEPEPVGPAAVISIDTVVVTPDQRIDIPIRMQFSDGGQQRMDSVSDFYFRVGFDDEVLQFRDTIELGEAISEWGKISAYITSHPTCASCPPSVITIQAQRHCTNDNASCQDQAFPDGILTNLSFRTTHGVADVGQATDIWFWSSSCRDNTFTRANYDYYFYIADSNYQDCDAEAMPDTMRCVRQYRYAPILSFHRGWVSIVEPGSGVTPGDINGNGIAFEASDAVLLSNLFPYRYKPPVTRGDSLFYVAGDCNRDGTPFTLADLEFLLKYITGDASLADTLITPNADTLSLAFRQKADTVLVFANATAPVSLAWLELIGDWAADTHTEKVSESDQTPSVRLRGDTLGILATNVPRSSQTESLVPVMRIVSSGINTFHTYDIQASTAPGVSMAAREVSPPEFPIDVQIGLVGDSAGSIVSAPITLTYESGTPVRQLGGFKLLIQYDADMLSPVEVTAGTAIDGWEYFTWRSGPNEGPDVIRIVGIFNLNDGHTPPPGSEVVEGPVATMTFTILPNAQNSSTLYNLRFFLRECGDNVISSLDGNDRFSPDLDYGDPVVFNGFQPDTCTVRDARNHSVVRLWSGGVSIRR